DCLLTCAPRTVICTLSLHDALPIYRKGRSWNRDGRSGEKSPPRAVEQGKPVPRGGAGPSGEGGRGMSAAGAPLAGDGGPERGPRSEEHTSELQSRENLVCRRPLEN